MPPLEDALPERRDDGSAPVKIPGGVLSGTEFFRELPPDAALAVWQVLRAVTLWSVQDEPGREGLFEPAEMTAWEERLLRGTFDPAVRNPLAVIIGELARPGLQTPMQLSWACVCVTEWALARRASRTALAYAEAAGLAAPSSPRYAWLAGRLLRTHGRLREAGDWFRRAIRLGSRSGDWDVQTLGLNSLGNASYERGAYREALHELGAALRSARRHGLHEREGELHHDLFVVHYALGDWKRAEEHALAACEIYGGGHHRLAALAHDIAFLWIGRGYFARALPILRELIPFFAHSDEQLRIVASAARAAGACGDVEAFEAFWNTARRLVDAAPGGARVASALVELAMGASSLGAWDRALEWLERASAAAQERGEADVVARAELARAAVQSRRVAETVRAAGESAGRPSRQDAVAKRLVRSLAGDPAGE